MMRVIWISLINGTNWSLFWWAAWLVFDIVTERWVGLFFDVPLLLLNVLSWDYQRRQRSGGAK